MRPMTKNSHHLLFLAIGAVVLAGFGRPNVAHASWSSEGHAAGAQCGTSGVNDNGVAAGTCTSIDPGGQLTAWVAINGVQTPLPSLAAGQPCSAGGVSDSGDVIGNCMDSDENAFGTFWTIDDPGSATVLQPLAAVTLLGVIQIDPDISTIATSFNQSGFIGGVSFNANGGRTAALWMPGSSTAVAVSERGENCDIAYINNSNVNGAPSIALNCANDSGTTTPYIAQATGGLLGTGLLRAYVKTPLPLPSGSSDCEVVAVNDSVQALGTCYFPGSSPEAAFWPSLSSAPTLLSEGGLPDGARTAGAFLNNNGNAVVQYLDTSGKTQSAFWNTSAAQLNLILPVSGGTQTEAAGLADDDIVILTSEGGNEHVQAAKWTIGGGTEAYGDYGGGQESEAIDISQTGNYTAGVGEDSAENENALVSPN
ncbi:hypothetical protein [Dyella sp.]|uniref:hypothetical protein n=1 Tax=Dyella sp. TaxID=1869338 RepID=UPI002D786C0A|nr:hypothetical protein [Dyella sp.]HET7331420.1 hypothetical protein [Dyella sp.]